MISPHDQKEGKAMPSHALYQHGARISLICGI